MRPSQNALRHEGYKKAKRRARREEEDEELRKPRLPVELIEKLKQVSISPVM